MASSCQNKSGSCACAPPVENKRTAAFYFVMITLGVLLLVGFNLVKGFEEEALSGESLSMVLVLGFLTGLHCIGMCGGFMMTYMRYGKKKRLSEFEMHFRYSVSKVLSYAFFGACFGLLGSFVNITSDLKSLVSFIGGFFLLYLGAKGLGVFNKLKKWSFKLPINFNSSKISSPTSIGLLKGLMISCAPLQALYLISASIGSPLKGALLLTAFGIGTLPIFLFYGAFVGSLNSIRKKWADIATAAILIFFGISMVNHGMALGGYNFNFSSQSHAHTISDQPRNENERQTLKMEADKNGWSKKKISYKYGQKIRWEIQVNRVTMCNKTIEIPKLGISKDLEMGMNIIEFDPGAHESLVYTCWMGMMTGEFIAEAEE